MNNVKSVEILLVEDNMSDAELVIRSLRKVNLANHLVHVKDGAEALDFLFAKGDFIGRESKKIPRVILLDIKMPVMDGFEFLDEIQKTPELDLSQTRIYMSTSSFLTKDKEKAKL